MSGNTTSEKVLASFLAGESRSIRNDSSIMGPMGIYSLALHGNTIATRFAGGEINATLAGWPTVTTRDRLNALCDAIGQQHKFSQSKNVQYYAGGEIDPDSWIWIRASDFAIAEYRKGIRLPKELTFEEYKRISYQSVTVRNERGAYWGIGGNTSEMTMKALLAKAKSMAKDHLAAKRALADLVKQDASLFGSDDAPEYSEPGNVNCKFGAPMGRGETRGDLDAAHILHLRGIHIDSGGYDNGGAYWGIGEPLYHLQGEEVDQFFRAGNRQVAVAWVKENYPNATLTS